MEDLRKWVIGGILGLAVGDALGVPVEFRSREELAQNPVTGMRAYGTHHQPAGTWSDDTTMTLCALESLTKGVDFDDMMDRFCRWVDEGYMTPYGKLFDMGGDHPSCLTPLHPGGSGSGVRRNRGAR